MYQCLKPLKKCAEHQYTKWSKVGETVKEITYHRCCKVCWLVESKKETKYAKLNHHV